MPTATGTYCFLGVYSGDNNYLGGSDSSTIRECFTVTPTPSVVTTIADECHRIVLGASNTDNATITGVNGVTPTGTVTFYVCGPFTTVTTCTTAGTNIGTVTLTGSGNTATVTSPAITPTATGTYCFLGVYSGDSNYLGASDGSTTRECFTVTMAPPSVVTAPKRATIVLGQTDSDTVVVTGNSAGGAPTGTVTFYECGPTTAPAPCTSKKKKLNAVKLKVGAKRHLDGNIEGLQAHRPGNVVLRRILRGKQQLQGRRGHLRR